MTGEQEWLETLPMVQKVAAILEDRSDRQQVAARHSVMSRRRARGARLAVIALISTGGSLALATIMQHTASGHHPIRAVRVVPYAAERMPYVVAVGRSPSLSRGKVAAVGIVQPPRVTVAATEPAASAPQATHLRSASKVVSAPGRNAPSPRLTGEALRLALIADAAKTRALNLKELALVDLFACRDRPEERC